MSLHRNPQAGFETRLRHIAAAGVELPPEIDQLRQRLRDFQRATEGHPIRGRLAQAVITADRTADRELLWAAALAELAAGPPAVADLREHVRLAVNQAIGAAYAQVAQPVYLGLAAEFNAAADKLAAAMGVVDVELPAEAAITLPAKAQQAWKDAAAAVAELNRLAQPLRDAAVLAGIGPEAADAALALMVDPGEVDPGELWHAWDTDERDTKAARAARNGHPFTPAQPPTRSRCGRWAAVLALGATVRACPPNEYRDYPRPRTSQYANA